MENGMKACGESMAIKEDRKAQVEVQVEAIDNQVNRIRRIESLLGEKLAPILRAENPPPCGGQKEEHLVPLADRMRSVAIDLDLIATGFEHILDRIEV